MPDIPIKLREGFKALLDNAVRGFDSRFLMSWYALAFDTYKRARVSVYGGDLRSLCCPSEPGLVSIVLPVYNGADLVREALDSILSQTYPTFELIAINDGSTDETPQILEQYARQDPRIRVFHQSNQHIPRTLSRGFRLARGEFLTWTSCDNRLKSDFLARLVDCLQRHPDWDMVYANEDIIGDDGNCLIGTNWFIDYQVPPGSPHIHRPEDTAELNIRANNYIGAAFMYRDRVAHLVGDYSPLRFTVEDYDYWMQVNELLTLRHADFCEPIYDYRLHATSLTARHKELEVLENREKLMVFDDFRRDFNQTPLIWLVEAETHSAKTNKLMAEFTKIARAAQHLVIAPDLYAPESLPRLWVPTVYLRFASDPATADVFRRSLSPNTLTVLITDQTADLPTQMSDGWDVCIKLGSGESLPKLSIDYQGWYAIGDLKDCFTALDVRARAHHLRAIETEMAATSQPRLPFSVVICTCKRSARLLHAIRSVARQSIGLENYQVIIVNNNPAEDLADMVAELREQYFQAHPDHLRLIICPLKGLSHARNAGIAESCGEIVCFLNDDAVAKEDWLAQLQTAYQSDSEFGAVGGKAILKQPDSPPAWFTGEGLGYWSHFAPGYESLTVVENSWELSWGANWSARRTLLLEMGGFRCRYGRVGDDFGGGGEIVAASLAKKLGYKVAVMPQAEVLHDVDPRRFTRTHLKNTIRAALQVDYQLQRDLYAPLWRTPTDTLVSLLTRLKSLLRFRRLSRFKRLETWYLILAEYHLLIKQVRDHWGRASRKV